MKKIARIDWDAIAGIVAAVAAIILHFFHVVDLSILLSVAVVLIALLFLRDLRRESSYERMEEHLLDTRECVKSVQANIVPSEVVLVGPKKLRSVTKDFSVRAQGEMIWFHICPLMFRRQELFDLLLRPAIENPRVDSIQFVMDSGQKELWQSDLAPKLEACPEKDKIREPCWTQIDENVSVIVSNIGSDKESEILLSFWGEPFMASTVGRQVPRYIFHVLPESELVNPLIELVRHYRIN